MSDFICSSNNHRKGELSKKIRRIYTDESPEVLEFHGSWGSMAVSKCLYGGFQPYENKIHIIAVIGGPILCFRDNSFLRDRYSNTGTLEIYNRWVNGKIEWGKDLDGPFAIIIINKIKKEFLCITDLMMFIPIYQNLYNGILNLSTHVDLLSTICSKSLKFDYVSMIDFVLNNIVTYPYTFYENILQCQPGSLNKYWKNEHGEYTTKKSIYWLPVENNQYSEINQSAKALRNGIEKYIYRITDHMDEVAHFISGGEDSRAIAGIIPEELKRQAFVFLDHMNREGLIAKKVAASYGATFNAIYRNKYYYIDVLPSACQIIGSGQQYMHAHSLGFHKTCKLEQYSAIFGGYLSDSLLKAKFARQMRGQSRFPFLPQYSISGETRTKPIISSIFNAEITKKITKRRREHFERVLQFRKTTAHEWFVLWPATMRAGIANFFCNRRLFRSYEPFLCNQAVKIGASVPINLKINRRLFYKAIKPFLYRSKHILSGDGRFPSFPWWANIPVQLIFWFKWEVITSSKDKMHQGPWSDWKKLMNSEKWKIAIESNRDGYIEISKFTCNKKLEDIFEGNELNWEQKVNLLQLLYIGKHKEILPHRKTKTQ